MAFCGIYLEMERYVKHSWEKVNIVANIWSCPKTRTHFGFRLQDNCDERFLIHVRCWLVCISQLVAEKVIKLAKMFNKHIRGKGCIKQFCVHRFLVGLVRGIMHSLILRGHEGWGWVDGGLSCDTQQPQKHLSFIKLFIFIQNIPKCINYIMKYLDCHL